MSLPSEQQPLNLRARPDVVAAAVRVAGSPRWVVTDPVTLNHFDLSDQEYAVLTALRASVSLRELQRGFERRFAPRRISLQQVWRVVSRLHEAGLAVAIGGQQGGHLVKRRRKRRNETLLWSWTRLLAIRLPGVNPDSFLDRVYPYVRWLMSPPAILCWLLLMLAAIATVVANFSALMANLPRLEQLLTPRSALALLVTAVGVKVLHELGHALACKHQGGRVREMGVLLLAFAPALYCDVTDLWRLPSKWKRISVTVAGIFVELVLAAIAVLVWRYSASPVLEVAALNVMIVCTVGTVLVNANPLMRYDGYYLLSDLTETPNLWLRSRQAVGELWSRVFLRGVTRTPVKPAWLPLYGVASQAYLTLVVVSIIWMLMLALRPYRLEVVAYALGFAAAAGAVAPAVRRAIKRLRDPASRRRLRGGRAAVAAFGALVILAGVLALPWRYTVDGEATVALRHARPVVATVTGRLVEVLPAGAQVQAGDVVARLDNPDVRRELARTTASLEAARLKVSHLELLRAENKEANDQLPEARANVQDLSEQLTTLVQNAARLELRAERAGVVVRTPREPEPRESDALTLARWSGALTDPENRGAWVETSQVIAEVADPDATEALLVLQEEDIERIAVGQPVHIAWAQAPGTVTHGQVVEIAERSSRSEHSSRPQPERPGYLVRVQLEDAPKYLTPGGIGRARVDTGSTSLARLGLARVRQLFRLP